MIAYINKKVLVTTTNWFYGTDGKQYRALYGTLKAVHQAENVLGFKPDRAHTNWFVEIGSMMIAGCQVLYCLQLNEQPNLGKAMEQKITDTGALDYERGCAIFVTD
jgi:hypothetical protein